VVLRPVGPLPPGAYWFRRLLLVVVVVLLLAIAWWFLGRGSGAEDPAAATPTPSATSSSPTPTTTQSEKSKPTKTKTKSTAAEAPECADKDIEVSVATDAEAYAPSELPTFTLTVENVSDETCSRDVGPAALELRVSSGGSRVWSSDDCNPGGDPRLKVLGPQDRFVQSVQWGRTLSQEGCPTPQESAEPGTYQVVARNQERFSDPAAFVLE
jgi:hypothetical protein